MSAHFESAISRLRLTSERRARTTVIAILATAQNGTSGALAGGNHAGRRAAWATPQTGGMGHSQTGVRWGYRDRASAIDLARFTDA